MKLTIAQALGTVLDIQINVVNREGHFVIRGQIDQVLGRVGVMTLDQAVWKAIELTAFDKECNFAIFPIGSNREDIYMAIEREMLRQEAAADFKGKKMWELLGGDVRDVVNNLMTQLRDCAVSLVNPAEFQMAMLRVCVLGIASMQWISDWFSRLRIRQAIITSMAPAELKTIPLSQLDREPMPPLFGVAGLQVLKEGDDTTAEHKAMPVVPATGQDISQEDIDQEYVDQEDEHPEPSEEALQAEREALGHDKPE